MYKDAVEKAKYYRLRTRVRKLYSPKHAASIDERYKKIATRIKYLQRMVDAKLKNYDFTEHSIKRVTKPIEEIKAEPPRPKKDAAPCLKAKSLDPDNPFKVMETKVVDRVEESKKVEPPSEEELKLRYEASIKMYMAEWCADFPMLSVEKYLEDVKKLDDKVIREIFYLVPKWKWIERQGEFADEVVRRITLRGANRALTEYDKDARIAGKIKENLHDIVDQGVKEESFDKDGNPINKFRTPKINEFKEIAMTLKTTQEVIDRATGITDQNREAIISNLKKQQVEEVEETEEVKEIRKITYTELKDIVACYREAKREKNKNEKKAEESGGLETQRVGN